MGWEFAVLLIGPLIVFALARARFMLAYLERQGAVGRRERLEMLFRGYLLFWAVPHSPPFTLSSYFATAPYADVEARRRRVLLAAVAIPVAIATAVFLLTAQMDDPRLVTIVAAVVLVGLPLLIVVRPT